MGYVIQKYKAKTMIKQLKFSNFLPLGNREI